MEDQKIQQLNSKLLAGGLTLNFFWVLNIFKESYAGVKSVLNFYAPIGPLLGLFVLSGIVFFVFYFLFAMIKPKSQKTAFWVYTISIIVFFLMVFPPFFEPLVGIIGR